MRTQGTPVTVSRRVAELQSNDSMRANAIAQRSAGPRRNARRAQKRLSEIRPSRCDSSSNSVVIKNPEITKKRSTPTQPGGIKPKWKPTTAATAIALSPSSAGHLQVALSTFPRLDPANGARQTRVGKTQLLRVGAEAVHRKIGPWRAVSWAKLDASEPVWFRCWPVRRVSSGSKFDHWLPMRHTKPDEFDRSVQPPGTDPAKGASP